MVAVPLIITFMAAMFQMGVEAHMTPCNQGNDTLCLQAVREQFISTGYWFGDEYRTKCPDEDSSQKSFECSNPAPGNLSIAARMLGRDDFDTNEITQFLHMRWHTPEGIYVACGHQFKVSSYSQPEDQDNTHTVYTDLWILAHRPTVTFDPVEGQTYALMAFDPGYMTLGGLWVNIKTGDTASGEEVYPYMGPVNPLYERHNPFVFALFRQTQPTMTNIESLQHKVKDTIMAWNGQYKPELLDTLGLEGPVAIGYVTVTTDAYGIQHFVDLNLYNNCPHLVAKNPDLLQALRVMGYQLTTANSYSDYRGTFLTGLEADLTIVYPSPEAHFESCCKHVMAPTMEVTLDALDDAPVKPLYMRMQPLVLISSIQLSAPLSLNMRDVYTLLMLDVTDAVRNATDHDVIIHWQVMNIYQGNVAKGDTVLSYLPPLPMTSGQIRTYVFLLLKQVSRVDTTALWRYTGTGCRNMLAMRCKFDFNAFLKNLNLQLSGVTMFRSQQDDFTRAVLYGSVDDARVPSSISQLQAMLMSNSDPLMSRKELCQGIQGYADPCPAQC